MQCDSAHRGARDGLIVMRCGLRYLDDLSVLTLARRAVMVKRLVL